MGSAGGRAGGPQILRWRHTLREDFVNVDGLSQAGLCMGCGMCEAVCPAEAVVVRRHDRKGIYLPAVDPELCTQCGLCLDVCPGESVDIERHASAVLDGAHSDGLIGVYHACYVGHAASQDIRYNASSGGLVTSLLVYAIEASLIDGALVLGMSESNPLETEPFIATTPSEVVSASGSKYCPSAINVGLRHILSEHGRFAVVGLPCQIHAVRKLETINTELRSRIVLRLGLFCANNTTYLGSEYLLRCNGVHPEDVHRIRYRAEGWPGKIRVVLRDGTTRIIAVKPAVEKRWYRRALYSSAFHYDFTIPRCLSCVDQTCELADIALGDPWLPEYTRSERIGKSLVIVRNELGARLVKAAMQARVVALEEVPPQVVKRAQNYAYKASVGARIRLQQALGRATPDYGNRPLHYRTSDLLRAVRYLPSLFSHHRSLWPLLSFLAIVEYATRRVASRLGSVSRSWTRRLRLGNRNPQAGAEKPR